MLHGPGEQESSPPSQVPPISNTQSHVSESLSDDDLPAAGRGRSPAGVKPSQGQGRPGRSNGGVRSAVGRRALSDIAVLRGRAERAADTLRIQLQSLLMGFAAHTSAAIGPMRSDWKPLGVFGWQQVENADGMDDESVDRVRALQKYQKKKDVLESLRKGTVGTFSVAAFAFQTVSSAASAVVSVERRGRRANPRLSVSKKAVAATDFKVKGRKGTANERHVIRDGFRKMLDSGPLASAPVPTRQERAVPSPREVDVRDQERKHVTRGKLGRRPLRHQPLPLAGLAGNLVGPSLTPSRETPGKHRKSSTESPPSSGAISNVMSMPRSLSKLVQPVMPRVSTSDVEKLMYGAGAGALAVGVGAAMTGGALTAALTASAAVVTISAVVSVPSSVVAAPITYNLTGLRRSRVVQQIDSALLKSANPSSDLAMRVKTNARESGLVSTPYGVGECSNPADLPEGFIPAVNPFDPNSGAFCLLHEYGLVDRDSHFSEGPQYQESTDGGLSLRTTFGMASAEVTAVDSFAGARSGLEARGKFASITSSVSTAFNVVDTDDVIDADAFEVLPSMPAVFSVPLLGALLNILDSCAFAVEQVAGRVGRRAVTAGFPSIAQIGSQSSWELHRFLQHRDGDMDTQD